MGSGSMGCGTQCSRITLVILNVIFLLCGTAFIILGALFRFGSDKLKEEVETSLEKVEIGDYNLYDLATNLAVVFMVAGGIMILFGIMGFIGACCMSRCALVVYAVLVGLCLCIELAGVILFFVMRNKLEEGVQNGLKKSISMANTASNNDVKQANQKSLEYLFNEFECCHVNSARLSSYGDASKTCTIGKEAYTKDCYEAIKDWIKHYQVAFIAIGISVIVVELLLITCSCALFRAAGKESRYG